MDPISVRMLMAAAAAGDAPETNGPSTISVRGIGGGGGGGGMDGGFSGYGGGGGAGEASVETNQAITASATYTITVGSGGVGSTSNAVGGTGGSSSLSGTGLSLSWAGGGGGGSPSSNTAIRNGASGACGGGGGGYTSISTGGTGSVGFDGGDGVSTGGAGGGGGMAAAGGDAIGSWGGSGGTGLALVVNGDTLNCAGGGHGGGNTAASATTTYGNGVGGKNDISRAAGDGAANTGAGGGGGVPNAYAGGDGGSGRVTISYPDTFDIALSVTGTYTFSQSGGYYFYDFTGDGTISFPAPSPDQYVEDVFSTYVYEGDGDSGTPGNSIVNGIDLAGEGGMVWIKNRDQADSHAVVDTERGVNKLLSTDSNAAESAATSVEAFNSDGFNVRSWAPDLVNVSGEDYASWTFRKAPGFFDVVTYTGNGVAGRTVAHNLGSAPGMIAIKKLDTANDWAVYHVSQGNTLAGKWNSTQAFYSTSTTWNNTTPTSSVFSLGTDGDVNASGGNYVAYLFAHDDARFGPSSNESIIKCGSYVGNGSTDGPFVNLGWEPQWIMVKKASGTGGGWYLSDTARGIVFDGQDKFVVADTTGAESGTETFYDLEATGFKNRNALAATNQASQTYIYMAIRLPDKAPAAGTDFFQVRTRAGTGATLVSSTSFNVDAGLVKRTNLATSWHATVRGFTDANYINTDTSDAIKNGGNSSYSVRSDEDSTVTYSGGGAVNNTGSNYVDYFFKRARGAFDLVLYPGDGQTANNIDHSLGAVPQMIWVKEYSKTQDWAVYTATTGAGKYLTLNSTAGEGTDATYWNNTSPTSSVFTVGSSLNTNQTNNEYVAYLFGNVSGVIDIGSYTGTGTAGLQIDCGFSAGARFVLIKRTDTTGNWVVFNTASGINTGSDPHLFLNLDSVEFSADYLDPYSPGFEVSTTTGDLNASGGTYIYMAIA